MKFKKFLLFYIIILNLSLFTLPILAVEEQKSFEAIADSTVEAYYPTTNYGGAIILYVGHFNNWLETYIKFDLSNTPSTFRKVELQLEFTYVEASSWVYCYETSTDWGEYTITWENAPSHGTVLGSVNVTEEIIYKIDITDDLQNKSGLWSVCLASPDMNWLNLVSRETFLYDPPQVIYTYEVSVLPIIMSTIAIIGFFGGVLGIAFYIKYRKDKFQ